MSLQDLSSALWCERELLETLQYKLEVERLLLETGREHRLTTAAREVDSVVERIRALETLRALEVDLLATGLGLAAGARLRDVAAACTEPWRTIWLDHRTMLTMAAGEVSTGLQRVHRLVLEAGPALPVQAPPVGHPVRTDAPTHVLSDEMIDRELDLLARDLAVDSVTRALPPSLAEFLR